VIAAARTGEIGDGRVFVIPVEAGYNIRTASAMWSSEPLKNRISSQSPTPTSNGVDVRRFLRCGSGDWALADRRAASCGSGARCST